MPQTLVQENIVLKNENTYLKQSLQETKEQLEWLKRQIFGKKSERIIPNETSEYMEFDLGIKEDPVEEKIITIPSHTRKKKTKDKDILKIPEDLPVETIILDIPEEQKICPKTGKPLIQIGKEVTYKLAHKPQSFYLKKYIRPKYALPKGEGIVIAEMPDSFISKSKVDESVLAEILTRKFADHLPCYRISEIFSREGIQINRKIFSQWIVRIGITLKPLFDLMLKSILNSGNIFIDETIVKMLQAEKCKTTYMLAITGGEEKDPVNKVYSFQESRSHKNITKLIKDYTGVFHSDKYGAYEDFAKTKQAIWCPCWVHIRRKFFEAQTKHLFKKEILRKIRHLFMLERIAWS